jgi:hypothetical protein
MVYLIFGDGTSSTLAVNLTKQPFNLTGFAAANPVSFEVDVLDNLGVTVTSVAVATTGDGDTLTVFSGPVAVPTSPDGSSAGISITPKYSSLG